MSRFAERQGVVKDLWALYITALDVKVARRKYKKDDTSSEDDSDEIFQALEENESNGNDEVASASNQSNVSKGYRSDVQVLKRYPLFMMSPLFSYLAIVILRLPITLGNIFAYVFLIAMLTTQDG